MDLSIRASLLLLMGFLLIACAPQGQSAVTQIQQNQVLSLANAKQNVEKTSRGEVIRVMSYGDHMLRALWNDPSVLKEKDVYVMYATANVGGKWGTVLPFRATSKDGLRWEMNTKPLLQLGDKGAFDEDSVETPSVVKFKGQYHMFYTGVVKGFIKQNLSIGHAVSDNGLDWHRVSTEPLLKPTGNFFRDWNGFHVAEPGAVVFNNRLYLYFHASGRREGGGKPGNQSSIGYVVSDDGITFSRMKRILTQGPLYPTSASERFLGYSTPSAEVVDGKIHLFYDVIASEPSWQQVALHHAVSVDGVNFKEDDIALLRRDDLSWTKTEIRAPTSIFENGHFKIWFAGHHLENLPVSGIGYIEVNVN